MSERQYPNDDLMDELYTSSIHDLVRDNNQALKEAGMLFDEGIEDMPSHIEIQLVPDFTKNPDGTLTADTNMQRKVALNVLDALHEKWNGSPSLEKETDGPISYNYWQFIDDDFIPWTVIEAHNSNPTNREPAVVAFMKIGAQRPAEYQEIINDQQSSTAIDISKSHTDSANTADKTSRTPEEHRKKRVAEKIRNWLKSQTDLPPRPNRFE